MKDALLAALVVWLCANRAQAFSVNVHSVPSSFASSLTRLSMADTDESSAAETPTSYIGKTVYQRTFHRLAPSFVAISKAEFEEANDSNKFPLIANPMVVEERLRYQVLHPDTEPDVVSPVGPRTFLLRDASVDEGRIGDVLAKLDVFEQTTVDSGHDHTNVVIADTAAPHTGQLQAWRSTVATALCLCRQPNVYLHDSVLQVAAAAAHDRGLSTLLACACSAVTQQKRQSNDAKGGEDNDNDILTVPHASSSSHHNWPDAITQLTLTDNADMDAELQLVAANLLANQLPADKVRVEPLDWNLRRSQQRSQGPEYQTVVVSDLASCTVPESKALARTVAHALEASNPYYVEMALQDKPLPRLVHVAQDARESVSYLQQFLQQGYRMNVDNDLVSVETIQFVIQAVDTLEKPTLAAEEAALDPLPLQVLESSVTDYRVVTATHHPDYTGGGSGEYFFPMETGQYEERQGGIGGGGGGAFTSMEWDEDLGSSDLRNPRQQWR